VSTTIQVSQRLRRRLALLRLDPRETYESVILRSLVKASPIARVDSKARGQDPAWSVIAEFKKAVQALYGERFDRLVVFGSVARNGATKESDIDLMLVLHGDVDVGREVDRVADAKYEIDLRHGTLTSVVPISLGDFLTRVSPLLMNVRREGIRA
jgi:predicted nucleotidyltransferase